MNGAGVYSQVQSGINKHPKQDLVSRYAPLVNRIAHHLLARLPSNILLNDLTQSGLIGLLEASKNYDASKGAAFETYATIRIRGAMLDEVRKGDWSPRSVHKNARVISEALKKVENRTGHDARDVEVAEELGVTLIAYHKTLREISSFRVLGFEDAGIEEAHFDQGLGYQPKEDNPYQGLQKDNFRKSLSQQISRLPEKEKMVLALYYDEELNLKEIGQVIGVSESRVSQIHSQAVTRLRSRLVDWKQ